MPRAQGAKLRIVHPLAIYGISILVRAYQSAALRDQLV